MSKHMDEIAADLWRSEIEEQANRVSGAYNDLHTEDPPDVHAVKLVRLRTEWVKYRALVETVKATEGVAFKRPMPSIGREECVERWGMEPWAEKEGT